MACPRRAEDRRLWPGAWSVESLVVCWFWGVWKDEWSGGGRGAGDEVKVVAMGRGQFDPIRILKAFRYIVNINLSSFSNRIWKLISSVEILTPCRLEVVILSKPVTISLSPILYDPYVSLDRVWRPRLIYPPRAEVPPLAGSYKKRRPWTAPLL